MPQIPISAQPRGTGKLRKSQMNNLEKLKSQGLRSEDVLGTIGPFKIFLGSLEALLGPFELPDEVMDALFYIISRSQPGTEPINSQAMRLILEGSSRARSTYFFKKNLKGASAVFGPYLVGECHWTLFHCNLKEGTIMYIDSLGEQPQRCSQIIENWSLFAASRGCQGPWKLINRDHDLQKDSVSCGVFSIMTTSALRPETVDTLLSKRTEKYDFCPETRRFTCPQTTLWETMVSALGADKTK
ncbi:hypothetical protein UPYG_G00083460 [Umbra pygmaea]|uniref:Ubiquitin-like protease family profile domain-containing protein n=1 Tax=Umbra pygmaea TaxID=75934 RepID=A0ABD0XE74_UMBPY